MNFVSLQKADFVLSRMDVYIHLIRRNIDKKHCHGKLPLHQSACKSLKERVLYSSVSYASAVHIDINPPGSAARDLRRGNPAGERNASCPVRDDSVKVISDVFAENICHPVSRVRRGYPVFDLFPIVEEREPDIGPAQSDVCHGICNVAHLRVDGLQKFPPDRRIKEQVLNDNQGSPGSADFGNLFYYAALYVNSRTCFVISVVCLNDKTGYRGNARKGLPSETEGVY